jgi:hypothetical protein
MKLPGVRGVRVRRSVPLSWAFGPAAECAQIELSAG